MMRKRTVGATSAVLALGLVGFTTTRPASTATGPTALVREAPFVESLVERGTVSAARLMLYGSTIAGTQAKLLRIVPEGTAVAPGDVLFEFDAAPFDDALRREEAATALAEADALRAREDLRLEVLRVEAEIEAAEEQVGFAESALTGERDGRVPLQIAEAEAAVNDTLRELDRARTAEADLRVLLDKGFVTRVEAERGAQALQQAEDRHRLATLRLKTLAGYEQPAAVDKSRSAVAAARKAFDNAQAAARSRVAQRRAAVAVAEGRVTEAHLRLQRARDQVARTTVRSEAAGLVVYRELFFGTEKRKPQPGDEVWPNQPLVAIPDPAQLVVETRVRETDLHRIATSQRVQVTVDAYPDLRLDAAVAVVGALAETDPARAGARYFPVTIRLLTADARLRTGMTARVQVEIATMPRAVVVPLQALVEDEGVTRCYVAGRAGVEARVVDVAGRNDLVAAVRTGVAAGERVLLVDASLGRPAPDRR